MKNTGMAAAGFMIVPRHVLGGTGFIAPSDKLNIAGIGAGGKGQSDITSFAESPNVNIVSLCDVDDRQAVTSRENFPKASYYNDFREMLDKEGKNIDAVSVSTPDHNHAVAAYQAMSMGKHVYVQKPLTHDIWEARMLTEAAKKFKVVTQMGNQGGSGDGVRTMKEIYDTGIIGEVHTVKCWTNRAIWPQALQTPTKKDRIPKGLNWDLWLGTAPYKEYVNGLVPFNWRGWWDYGTGALGDMGCHLIEAPYRVLDLKYPKNVECSVGSVYVDEFKRGYFPESCPPSSHVTMTFDGNENTDGDIKLHWMDGGIQPTRPEELGPNEVFGDGGNGVLIIGTKGKMMCGTYSENPQLLPTSKTERTKVAEKLSKKGTNCTIVNAQNIPMNPFHRGMTDEIKILSKQIEQADNIIIGMGVHCYSISDSLKILLDTCFNKATGKFYAILCAAGGERSYLSTMHLTQICMNEWRMIQLPRIIYATKKDFKEDNISSNELLERIDSFTEEFYSIGKKLIS